MQAARDEGNNDGFMAAKGPTLGIFTDDSKHPARKAGEKRRDSDMQKRMFEASVAAEGQSPLELATDMRCSEACALRWSSLKEDDRAGA